MTSSSITGGHLSDHHSDRVVEGSKSLESKSTVSLSEEIYNRSRDDKDPDDERGATSVVLEEKCSDADNSGGGEDSAYSVVVTNVSPPIVQQVSLPGSGKCRRKRKLIKTPLEDVECRGVCGGGFNC